MTLVQAVSHRVFARARAGVGWVAVAVCLVSVVAACGSSSHSTANSGTSPSGSASGATTVKAPTGAPINLIVIGTEGSPATSFPEAFSAAKAAAAAVNAAGGLQGRPLNVITCNDNNDVNTAIQCARTAVADHVIADVGDVSTFNESYMSILQAAGIPSLGNDGVSAAEVTDSNSYPLQAPSAVLIDAVISNMIKHGDTKVAVAYLDVPTLAPLFTSLQKEIPLLGGTLSASIPIDPTAVDYAPYAAKVKASGSNAIFPAMSTAKLVTFIQALSAISSDAAVGAATENFTEQNAQQLGAAAASRVLMVGSNFPQNYNANPGIAEFNKEMNAYGMKDDRDDLALASYVSVHLVANLLQKAPTISAAALVTALHAAGTIYFPSKSDPILAPVNFNDPIPAYAPQKIYSDLFQSDSIINANITPQTGFECILPSCQG
jgi:ABC-type branched-subunit amino acid transport system substrate-binding protein